MISVILLMAGSGTRMKYHENKILMKLNNKYLFEYPLELFLKHNFEVICVIQEVDEEKILPIIDGKCKWTYGGKTRQESVYNGLKIVNGDYIIIHDSARCLLADEVINKIEDEYNIYEAILCYNDVKDTIKLKSKNQLITLDRNNLISASTPQCASKELLLKVHEKAIIDNIITTDDISLIEKYSPQTNINLIKSNEENFKVTTPLDYKLCKLLVGDLK